jgi:pilus assembly protein CpaB
MNFGRSGVEKLAPVPVSNGRHLRLASSGVVIALFFALVGGLLAARNGKTTTVVVAARQISAGTVISESDVRVERIPAGTRIRFLSGDQLGLTLGKVTQLPIAPGSVMVPEQLSDAINPPTGAVLVGAALDAGAVPVPSIRFNDAVEVFETSAEGGPAVLLTRATIWKAWSAVPGSSRMVLTLAVPSADRAKVVGAAASGKIRLVLLPGLVGRNSAVQPVDFVDAAPTSESTESPESPAAGTAAGPVAKQATK